MFTLFTKVIPAADVADALWTEIRDGHMTRELAAAASEDRSHLNAALDEVVYFRGFATDLTIHRVFHQPSAGGSALRESFLQRLRDYAIARRCTPCPVGDWLADSADWQVHSPGRDTGDPLKHLSDRFDIYIAAVRRPSQHTLPVVGVLCGLCDTRDISFVLLATSAFVDYSINTQDFLRKIRVKP
jgi:hypothetical protein